MKKRSNEKVRA